MAHIRLKDLPQDLEVTPAAMKAVRGGLTTNCTTMNCYTGTSLQCSYVSLLGGGGTIGFPKIEGSSYHK